MTERHWCRSASAPPALAEDCDPASLSIGAMTVARMQATAVRLPTGRVIVAGENSGGLGHSPLQSAALLDGIGSFAATGAPTQPLSGHTATLLVSGKVPRAPAYTISSPVADMRFDGVSAFVDASERVWYSGGRRDAARRSSAGRTASATRCARRRTTARATRAATRARRRRSACPRRRRRRTAAAGARCRGAVARRRPGSRRARRSWGCSRSRGGGGGSSGRRGARGVGSEADVRDRRGPRAPRSDDGVS